jgi:hypothetical protein
MKNFLNYSRRRLDIKLPSFSFGILKNIGSSLFHSSSNFYKSWGLRRVDIDPFEPSLVSQQSIDIFLKSLEFGRVNEYLLYAIVYTDQGFLTVCNSFMVNRDTSAYFIQQKLALGIARLNEMYDSPTVKLMAFRYREVISPPTYTKPSPEPLKGVSLKHLNRTYLTETYAPFRPELSNWGYLYKSDGNFDFFHYSVDYDIVREYIGDGVYNVSVLLRKEDGRKLLDFVDRVKDDRITRCIGNDTIFIANGKVINVERKLPSKYIPASVGSYIQSNEMKNLITFDIEAYLDSEGTFIPYACGWCIDELVNLYFLKDFDSPQAMIQKAFGDILGDKKLHRLSVYIHNNKNFDAYFILKALIGTAFHVQPLFRDGKMISIKIIANRGTKNAVSIKLIDSYMVLPESLAKLARAFKCKDPKGIFPYHFVNPSTLNYRGAVPDYSFFEVEKASYSEYINYKKDISSHYGVWDLWEQTGRYLKADLLALYQVMSSARRLVYEQYNVDICTVLSASSLSFKIYRSKFMAQIPLDIIDNRENYSYDEWVRIIAKYTPKIPIITKPRLANELRQAYYGGLVDVFIPRGENLFKYDVNSMYPFAMLKDMPIGDPTFSTDSNLDNYFGFCYAKIKTPDNIKIPVLPYKSQEDRLVCPIGEWTGWYFSEELKNARDNHGYTIKVIHGYMFERGKGVFKQFVEHFYKLKQQFQGEGLGVIAKLLLNSLYGRLGMKAMTTRTEIVTQIKHEKLVRAHDVINFADLGDGYELVTYNVSPNHESFELHSKPLEEFFKKALSVELQNEHLNISVPISAAITAYGRIEINKYLRKHGAALCKHRATHNLRNASGPPIQVYYRDTDCVVLSAPLPANEVGGELGQMKLEHKIKNGIFIAPKLYYLHVLPQPNQKDVIKARGLGGELTLAEFEQLYRMQIISRAKDKWFKNIIKGAIQVKSIMC